VLGGGSLPEREWDHANSHKHKQKQVKCASKKMGFNGGVKLFFHFTFSFFKSEFFSIAGLVGGSPFYLGSRQHGKTFSKDTEKLFACNSLKLEEHASFSSARTTNRFPSPRCASTIQIVRP
jgi:hypothetical protein